MKILIFSDSHGSTLGMKRALSRNPDVDVLLHLGDGKAEFDALAVSLPHVRSYSVCGNCDRWENFGSQGDYERMITLEGVGLLLTHGHRFGVKDSLERYLAYAKARGVRCALFGHTHIPLERYDPDTGITLFNPGSISRPCGGAPSFGTLEIRGDSLLFGHGEI